MADEVEPTEDDTPQVRFRSQADMGSRISAWMKQDQGRSFVQGMQDHYDAVGGSFAQAARGYVAPPPPSDFVQRVVRTPEPEAPAPPPPPENLGEITHRPIRATSDLDAEVVDAEIVEEP